MEIIILRGWYAPENREEARAYEKELIKIFTKVGLSLTSISLFPGTFIGLSGTVLLKYNDKINFLSEMYQDRTIPAVFMPSNYLMILLGALLIAWISCYTGLV